MILDSLIMPVPSWSLHVNAFCIELVPGNIVTLDIMMQKVIMIGIIGTIPLQWD